MNQQSFIRAVVVKPVQGVINCAGRDFHSQMIARHAFHRVCFVKYDRVIIGQKTNTHAAQRQITEKQCVVDDQNLGIADAATRSIVKALFVSRTVAAHAIAAIAGDLVPDIPAGTIF